MRGRNLSNGGRLKNNYVHGYTQRESTRLQDQASTLQSLLHCDTFFPEGSLILEAGCGVGAQTIPLAKNNPHSQITAIDISAVSLADAARNLKEENITNVSLRRADIYNLPFQPETFDHIFICFVLEHLAKPLDILITLKNYLKPGGSIVVIEGDHGSTFFYPDSYAAHKAIDCQIELQRLAGGNALIGRELYSLLNNAGFNNVNVSPRMVYADSSKPALVDGFNKKTFTAMIEGVREDAIISGLIDEATFDLGIKDLYRTTEKDGVFCYTFFKAVATK
jgi:ubiquinone/menaquinone biosynthesis C-methylase UbiE